MCFTTCTVQSVRPTSGFKQCRERVSARHRAVLDRCGSAGELGPSDGYMPLGISRLSSTSSRVATDVLECPMATNLFSFSGLSLRDVARRTWAEILEDDVFGRAAQLAYYFFLALFPFLIFVIASLCVFGFADRGRVLLFQFVAGALPPSAFELIDRTFSEIIHSSGPLKMSFGIVASLWSASMGMSAIMDTLNAAYKVKENRSLFKQYAVATGLTLGIAFLLVISVVIVLAGDKIARALSPGNILAIAWKVVQWPLALALILLAFAITNYFAANLPNRQ